MPAQEMLDLHNAVVILIITVIAGAGAMVATLVGIFKWYLPNQFKHRDEQRQIENEALRAELETKRASDAVDIERERLLPRFVENNQRLVDAMIQSNQANTSATLQRIDQDKTSAAVMEANTKQLTANNDRLEENSERLEAVEKKMVTLHDRFTTVFPREKSIDELFNELKSVVAETKQVVADREHDSRPIPTIKADITLHAATKDDPPDVLKPTG